MDRLESMIDDYGRELASLKDRMLAIEEEVGGSMDTSALKVNIDE